MKRANAKSKSSNKKAKIEEKLFDLTSLPMEILLDIFEHVERASDGQRSLIKLTEVCKRFNDILSPKLKLNLNNEMFKTATEAPIIQRAYRKIIVTGYELNPAMIELLNSSQETARILLICPCSSLAYEPSKIKMHLSSLVMLLKRLPNLEELTFEGVNAIKSNFEYEKMKDEDLPVLDKLKVFNVSRTFSTALTSIKMVKSIERMTIGERVCTHFAKFDFFGRGRGCLQVCKLISAQTGLLFLSIPMFQVYIKSKFPKLQELSLDLNTNQAAFRKMDRFPPVLKKLTMRGTLVNKYFLEHVMSLITTSLEEIHFDCRISFEPLPQLFRCNHNVTITGVADHILTASRLPYSLV